MDTKSRTRYAWAMGVILLVAFLLRLWYLSELVHAPDFASLRQDMSVQDYQARAMLSGDWTLPEWRSDPEIPTTPYYRPPGYAYLLAVIYFFTNGSYLAPRLLNVALGLFSILLTARLARVLFGGGAALITAALMATYWGFIYYEGEVNDPAVFVFLLPCLLLTLRAWGVTRAARWAALAGVIMGCYALMRPNILLYGPLMAAWMLLMECRAGRLTRTWRAWASLAGITALVIAPVTARNYIVSGEFVPISTYFGENLLIGNSEHSDGVTSWTPYLQELEGTGQFSVWEYANIVRGLGREVGNENLTHSEASRIFAQKALHWMRENKLATLRLTIKKAALFWSPWEITENKVVHYEKAHYAPLKYLPGFPYLFALFLVGALVMLTDWTRGRLRAVSPGLREDRRSGGGYFVSAGDMLLLLYGLLLSYYVSFLPFFVNARARHPIVGLMAVIGAYGVYRCLCAWRGGRRKTAVVMGLLFVLAYGVAQHDFYPYTPDKARWHYARADSWLRTGELDKARLEAEQMLDEDYSYYMPFRLGHAFAAKGCHALAATLLEKALSPDPDNQPLPYRQDIYFHIGVSLAAANQPEAARAAFEAALHLNPNDARAHNDLGVLLEEAGDVDGALIHYRAAIKAKPGFALAHSNLCDLLGRLGNHAEAIAACEKAAAAEADNPDYRYNLAVQLAAAGQTEKATEHYWATLAIAPRETRAMNNLALLLEEQGLIEEAEALLKQALDNKPDFSLARVNLANIYTKQGKFEQAEALYLAGLQAAPDDVVLRNGIGYHYAARGVMDKARKHYEAALKINAQYDRARVNLIALCVQTEALDAALQHLAFLMEKYPDEPQLLLDAAMVQWKMGNKEDAMEKCRRALEMDPGFAAARRQLQQMDGTLPEAME